VPIGLGWWRHLVCAVHAKHLGNGRYAIVVDNSHGKGSGVNGRVTLAKNKAIPNDACAPSVMLPTAA
jgi:hypothetical protein